MIKIRYSVPASLEISGDLEALQALRHSILTIIETEGSEITVEATTSFDPAPYEEVVSKLTISIGHGPTKVEVTAGREVRVSGSVENLKDFASCFDFGLGSVFGPHRHYEHFEGNPYIIAPDSVPLVVIIE